MRTLRHLAPQLQVPNAGAYANSLATVGNRIQLHDGEPPSWAKIRAPADVISVYWPFSIPPTVKNLCDLMNAASSRLAHLALTTPDPANAQVSILQREKEMEDDEQQIWLLQVQLGKAILLLAAQFHPPTLSDLLASLPAHSAIVDITEYTNFSPPPDHQGPLIRQQRLVAFILRPDHELTRIELGPSAAVNDQVKRWRAGYGGSALSCQAASELRKLIWEPLIPALDNTAVILVSLDDGPLSEIPLGALPGDDPKNYLIEEKAIAVEPSPQALLDLLASPQSDSARQSDNPILLSLGDVDYTPPPDGASQDAPALAGGRSLFAGKLPALPGTGMEIDLLAKTFTECWPHGQQEELKGRDASIGAVQRQAPGCNYLHFATHGFYEPIIAPDSPATQTNAVEEMQSPVMEAGDVLRLYPSLWSGIVLAGGESGILSGMECEELNLDRADLVVLSACETGLGETSASEGAIGLPRAFHIAGARTVVSTLWSVYDEQTRELMDLFYRNLWQKHMGKLEALRQAQIELLNVGAKSGVQTRGLRRTDQPDASTTQIPGKLPPVYWAAFVLSGDWR
jgi:CHAT domain-containing protein